MKGKSKNILLGVIFLNYLSFSLPLSEIEGISKLENYNEIKNIEVERVVDYDDYNRDKKINKVFVNGENKPFSGLGLRKKSGKIMSFTIYKDGIAQGVSHSYDINGRVIGTRINKDDQLVKAKFLHKDGTGMYHIYEQIEGDYGIKTNYYPNNKIAAKMNVKVDYGIILEYINHGETTVYEKNGNLWGILNFKNNSAYGLPQKLFKNGKLKYEFISAAEVGEKLETMTYFKEYFDKSDKLKLDCDEVSSGEWHCKEYKKDGTLKNEFTSPTYKPKKDNSFWINAFLGIWNILF